MGTLEAIQDIPGSVLIEGSGVEIEAFQLSRDYLGLTERNFPVRRPVSRVFEQLMPSLKAAVAL